MISGKGENYGMSSFELELEEKLKLHEEVQEMGEFTRFKFLMEEKKGEKEAMPGSYLTLIKPDDEWGSSVSKIFLPLSSRNLLEKRAKSWWEKIEKHDIRKVRKNVEPALSPWEFLFSREKEKKFIRFSQEIYKIWTKEIEEIIEEISVRIIREELLRRAEDYCRPVLDKFIKKVGEGKDLKEEDFKVLEELKKYHEIAKKLWEKLVNPLIHIFLFPLGLVLYSHPPL